MFYLKENFRDLVEHLRTLSEKQKKGFIIVIIVICGLILGFFWIRSTVNSLSKIGPAIKSAQMPSIDLPDSLKDTPAPADATADWKTYTNTEYGFEVKYPSTVKIETSSTDGTSASLEIAFLADQETIFTGHVFARVYTGDIIKTMPAGEASGVTNFKNNDVLVQISREGSGDNEVLAAIKSTFKFTK